MKKILTLLLIAATTLLTTTTATAQDTAEFVCYQLQTYPQSRLLDLYKSCFQDFMGPEHLIADRQRAQAYLDEELDSTPPDDLLPWYAEPCGISGCYVRVSLRVVQENLVPAHLLLDAFVRSANTESRPTVESWHLKWQQILATIEQLCPDLPDFEQDKQFIEDLFATGKYAISHSPQYREVYRPHYRIVERSIFENEIKPLISHREQP